MSDEKEYFVTDGEHWAFHTGNGRYGRWCKASKHQAMPFTLEEAQRLKTFLEDFFENKDVQIITIEEWRQLD